MCAAVSSGVYQGQRTFSLLFRCAFKGAILLDYLCSTYKVQITAAKLREDAKYTALFWKKNMTIHKFTHSARAEKKNRCFVTSERMKALTRLCLVVRFWFAHHFYRVKSPSAPARPLIQTRANDL